MSFKEKHYGSISGIANAVTEIWLAHDFFSHDEKDNEQEENEIEYRLYEAQKHLNELKKLMKPF